MIKKLLLMKLYLMIDFKCQFCNSKNKIKDTISIFHKRQIKFVLCDCNIWQQLDPPSLAKIEDFFNSKNFTYSDRSLKVEGYSDYFIEEHNRIKTSTLRVNQLNKILNFNKNTRLLKIGCGTGSFLYKIKKITSFAEGIDLSKKFSLFAKKNYGVKVTNANYDKFSYVNKFDVILMFNVIENLSNPKKTVQKIHSDLKKNGYFIANFIKAENLLLKLTRSYFFMFRPPVYNIFETDSFLNFIENNGFLLHKVISDTRYFSLIKILLLLDLRFFEKILPNFIKNFSIKLPGYPSKILIFKKI